MANIPTVGLAKQTGFGTNNTSFKPIKVQAINSDDLTFDYITNDSLYGTIDGYPDEIGRRNAQVGFNHYVQPESIGYFLQMLAGDPTTTGAGPYQHVFTPGSTLPNPFTVGIDAKDPMTFSDVLPTSFSLSQDLGGFLQLAFTGMSSDRTSGAITISGSPESSRPYKFKDFSATVAGASDLNFKTLKIDVTNPVSNVHTLNGASTAVSQEYTGKRTVAVSGTIRFVSDAASYRSLFEGYTSTSLQFVWTIDASTSLTIDIPDFRFTSHSVTKGFNETEVNFAGTAFYDGTKVIEFTLSNSLATY